MAPTQRHRWLTRAGNRELHRRRNLRELDVDVARLDFARRHGDARMGPVVAVIAAFEEEDNLGDVLKAMPTMVGDLEVSALVVVDGQTDATDRVAIDAGAATCVLPVNLGQGAALRLGYELALAHGARFIVTLDADGQNDPGEIGDLLRPIFDGHADVVIASRRLGMDHTTDRFRRAGVELYASVVNAITRQHLTDTSNGFRAFRAEVIADILPHLRQEQYQTAEVLITTASRGWRIDERPTEWHPRASGQSKKGGNLFFGLQYARVIAQTWARTGVRDTKRA